MPPVDKICPGKLLRLTYSSEHYAPGLGQEQVNALRISPVYRVLQNHDHRIMYKKKTNPQVAYFDVNFKIHISNWGCFLRRVIELEQNRYVILV